MPIDYLLKIANSQDCYELKTPENTNESDGRRATAYMWRYEGSVDASGKVLTLDADGSNFMSNGKVTKFQDIYEFKSKDEMVMTSKMLGDDGNWITFMSGTAVRHK